MEKVIEFSTKIENFCGYLNKQFSTIKIFTAGTTSTEILRDLRSWVQIECDKIVKDNFSGDDSTDEDRQYISWALYNYALKSAKATEY